MDAPLSRALPGSLVGRGMAGDQNDEAAIRHAGQPAGRDSPPPRGVHRYPPPRPRHAGGRGAAHDGLGARLAARRRRPGRRDRGHRGPRAHRSLFADAPPRPRRRWTGSTPPCSSRAAGRTEPWPCPPAPRGGPRPRLSCASATPSPPCTPRWRGDAPHRRDAPGGAVTPDDDPGGIPISHDACRDVLPAPGGCADRPPRRVGGSGVESPAGLRGPGNPCRREIALPRGWRSWCCVLAGGARLEGVIAGGWVGSRPRRTKSEVGEMEMPPEEPDSGEILQPDQPNGSAADAADPGSVLEPEQEDNEERGEYVERAGQWAGAPGPAVPSIRRNHQGARDGGGNPRPDLWQIPIPLRVRAGDLRVGRGLVQSPPPPHADRHRRPVDSERRLATGTAAA